MFYYTVTIKQILLNHRTMLNNFEFFVANGNGIVGKKAYLEGIIASIPTLGAGQSAFNINFKWDSDMGIPGAFIITNHMNVEFFLVSLTLEDIPNQGTMHFVCNSWVYNYEDYKQNRIFFVNEVKLFTPS